jgi:hypothetical protein
VAAAAAAAGGGSAAMATTKTILLAAILGAPLAARPQPEPGSGEAKPAPDLSAPAPTLPPPHVVPLEPAVVAAPAAAAKKHGIFPIWGDKVRAKGFDLPEPIGFMVNYYNQQSDIEVTNLKLRFNGGEVIDADAFIAVPDARTEASALAIRPNVMIFPFLSVYSVFSVGATETNVHVNVLDELQFDTVAKSGAQVVSLGVTFQMGYKGFFGVADFNGSVSDVERLADAVGANMLSFRVGYNHKLNAEGRGVALWAGTMGQVLDVETKGSVRLGEVIPPPSQATIDEMQARCDALGSGVDGLACDRFVDRLRNYDPNSTVEYSLDKKPAGVWNMILGAQYALDRNWHFRVETTFLNQRTTFLAATEYRFDYL